MLRKEPGNSSSEAPLEVPGLPRPGVWSLGEPGGSLEGQSARLCRRPGNRSPSSDYYFHLHHSLASTEDVWVTRRWEISVNLWNKMDERFDQARTQTFNYVGCDCEPDLLFTSWKVVCMFGRAGGNNMLACGP